MKKSIKKVIPIAAFVVVVLCLVLGFTHFWGSYVWSTPQFSQNPGGSFAVDDCRITNNEDTGATTYGTACGIKVRYNWTIYTMGGTEYISDFDSDTGITWYSRIVFKLPLVGWE